MYIISNKANFYKIFCVSNISSLTVMIFCILGMGYFTSEELIYSKEGALLTSNTWRYKPPGAKDIPLNFRIKFPENNPNPIGILKSKGMMKLVF